MLIRLSLRNAKRQFSEYAFFFVTLIGVAASMYAFNALIFSDIVEALPDLEILPYLIITASLLIIFIIGWVISYMIHYMLKRRSKEFSVYMVCGISNRKINMLIFLENSLIGILAFGPGILSGMLFSQILEAALLSIVGRPYTLHLSFSAPAAGLTFLYFAAMLLYSIRKNRKWIRRVELRDMLYYDRQNEKMLVSGSASMAVIFILSVFSCVAGFLFIYCRPFGKGYDILVGIIFLVLFLFGFFICIPAFLVTQFGNRTGWKYRSQRLITFRGFTAKISSASIVMAMLSILFMLAISFCGIAVTAGMLVTKTVESGAFDIMILHRGELFDSSKYAAVIRQNYTARDYTYGIYTDEKTDFLAVRDQVATEAGRSIFFTYAEFQYDACMAQSDYLNLCKLLGYERLELDSSLCYVHCVPALEKSFKELIRQRGDLESGGYAFAADGVFSEPFSLMNDYGYGNGSSYVIIVPDDAVNQMQSVYWVYAAVTEMPLNADDIQEITDTCSNLVRLSRSSAKSDPNGLPTLFTHEDADYLAGKWMDKTEYQYLYSILICLLYLALILEMTGAAVLATQILSDWQMKQRQDRILRQLGMDKQLVSKLNSHQLSGLFLLPVLPSLVLSACFVYICAKKILLLFFLLPVIPDILWIGQSLGISWVLFFQLYAIYYAAARISYEHRISR